MPGEASGTATDGGPIDELPTGDQGDLSFAREIIKSNEAPSHHHHQCLRWTGHLRSDPMRPVHVGGHQLQPSDAPLGTEYMNVVLDKIRHWNKMCLGYGAPDAERSTHVLTMDQNMHQSSDRLTTRPGWAIGSGVSKGLQDDRWVLPTPHLPISGYPPVVVEAVAQQPTKDHSHSESTLRACGQVGKNVPDTPRATQ